MSDFTPLRSVLYMPGSNARALVPRDEVRNAWSTQVRGGR